LAYKEADIVGANPAFRIGMEFRNSIVGYMGVVNGNAFLANLIQLGSTFRVTENWVLAVLGRKFFNQIVSSAGHVNFIGPHESIGSVLSEMGARSSTRIIIPSDNIVQNSNHRPHYPEVYQEVLAEIRKGVSGLWLVSGGAFGKIYCNEVKKAGGVAIDIGSISDTWMGLRTR
jgi:hypothetical protein